MKDQAIEKLKNELKELKEKGSAHAQAVAPATCEALCGFCAQQEEFAQAVAQSEKTLLQVCEACVKGVGGSVSDLEVYRRAVAEYFPGAAVDCVMTVRMSEHEEPAGQIAGRAEKPDVLSLDLFDLMGG